jgi:hypothetical protein
LLHRVGRHPELSEPDAAALLVEEAQHDAFTAERRERRDADVDLAVLEAQPDATVLRQPTLGDVELRHDLQPANDGRREVLRR